MSPRRRTRYADLSASLKTYDVPLRTTLLYNMQRTVHNRKMVKQLCQNTTTSTTAKANNALLSVQLFTQPPRCYDATNDLSVCHNDKSLDDRQQLDDD